MNNKITIEFDKDELKSFIDAVNRDYALYYAESYRHPVFDILLDAVKFRGGFICHVCDEEKIDEFISEQINDKNE